MTLKFVDISKQGGIVNKKRTHIPYKEGDNDFYWFHEQNESIFYVITESILINKGFITTSDQKGTTSLCMSKHTMLWLKEYQFDYSTICGKENKTKLLKLLNVKPTVDLMTIPLYYDEPIEENICEKPKKGNKISYQTKYTTY